MGMMGPMGQGRGGFGGSGTPAMGMMGPGAGGFNDGGAFRSGGKGQASFARQDPLFGALDADGDDMISSAELDSATTALRPLDRDGDGNLSREELRATLSRQPRTNPDAREASAEGMGPVFRAYRYGPNYPGLVGRELVAGERLEEQSGPDSHPLAPGREDTDTPQNGAGPGSKDNMLRQLLELKRSKPDRE